MNFEPFGDRVLILPDILPTGEKRIGLLVIPDVGKNPDMTTGTVQALGPEAAHLEMSERVLYSPYAGMKLSLGGTDYWLLNAGEVMGRLTKDAVAKVS